MRVKISLRSVKFNQFSDSNFMHLIFYESREEDVNIEVMMEATIEVEVEVEVPYRKHKSVHEDSGWRFRHVSK